MSKHLKQAIRTNRANGAASPGPGNAVLSFLGDVAKDAASTPNPDLARILYDYGYAPISDNSEDAMSSNGSFGSFSLMAGSASSASMEGFVDKHKRANALAPFSSELVYRSVNTNRDEDASGDSAEENKLVTWRGDAAILFIDLSGYSSISAALISSGGAHAMSNAVNGYFDSILSVVVDRHRGDVLKFAGDAIVVTWLAGGDPARACLTAVACAIELQKKCGMHPVEGTELFFRLHIGITFGTIDSEVFMARDAETMQRAFHFVSGEPLAEVGPIVDSAKKGEICCSNRVAEICNDYVSTNDDGRPPNVRMVKSIEENYFDGFSDDLNDVDDEEVLRDKTLESRLVHPTIARKLRQGFQTRDIAELRYLAVLFISKELNTIGTEDWFREVQKILDVGRCPIVQIIDDDKGVHIVAAVNLYVSEIEAGSVALDVTRQLRDHQVGCAVGVACGEVFCGITGSENACRWDITGPACVRAARLMQLAQKEKVTEAIDASVYKDSSDVSQLELMSSEVVLKGSPDPLTVYKLSANRLTVTSGIMKQPWLSLNIFADERMTLADGISHKQRSVSCISGNVGSGKKALVYSIVGNTHVVIVHQMTRGSDSLCVGLTLCQWFMHHEDEEIKELATRGYTAVKSGFATQSLNLCLGLVDLLLKKNMKVAFIIQYGQFLDTLTGSFLHQLMRSCTKDSEGEFHVFVTVIPLYGMPKIKAMIHRNNKDVTITSVKLSPIAKEDFKYLLGTITFWKTTDRYTEAYWKKTGGLPGFASFLVEKMRLEFLSRTQQRAEGKDVEMLSAAIAPGMIDLQPGTSWDMESWSWSEMAPAMLARMMEQYDVLSPRLQIIARVVAVLNLSDWGVWTSLVYAVMSKIVSKATNDLVDTALAKLQRLGIIQLNALPMGATEVKFTSPQMLEVVSGLLTPEQTRTIRKHAARACQDVVENEHYAYTPEYGKAHAYQYIAWLWIETEEKDKAVTAMKTAFELRTYLSEMSQKMIMYFLSEFCDKLKVKAETVFGADALTVTSCGSCKANVMADPRHTPNLQWCKDSMPPMALASYAGEVQKMCYWACLRSLHKFHEKEKLEWANEQALEIMSIDTTKLMKAIERFENVIPKKEGQTGRLISEEDEKALFDLVQTKPTDYDDALTRCDKVRAYYEKVFVDRHERMMEYIKSADVCVRPMKGTKHVAALSMAFGRLHRDDSSHEIPVASFHEALMDLATDNFETAYMHLNLQTVRDACLRQQTATLDDFKAMLFNFILMGTHISSAEKRLVGYQD